jgi:hypothetical protein
MVYDSNNFIDFIKFKLVTDAEQLADLAAEKEMNKLIKAEEENPDKEEVRLGPVFFLKG